MISKTFQAIEKTEVSMTTWILSFTGVLFIRYLFEAISSPPLSGSATFDFLTIIHYSLFYITVGLTLTLIVTLFVPTKKALIVRLTPLVALITALPPIIDLIATKGLGSGMMYLLDKEHTVWYDLVTFFGPNLQNGITLGIRIEIALLVLGIGWFVFYFSKNIMRTVAAALCSYICLFVLVSIPSITLSIINMIHGIFSPVTTSMLTDFFMNSLSSSVLLHTASNPAISFTSISSFFYTYFNIIVGQFFFLVSIIIGTCLLLKMHTEKVRAVLRNIRPERLAHYLGLAVLGAAFALYRGETISFGWTTILPAIVLIVSITCAWIAAVFSNDLIDIEADKISDPLRPLTSGTLSRTEMRDVAIVAQIIALTGAFLIGPTTTYLIATFSIMYAIYSLPPLRLKQVPFLASTLIAIACIAILLTGFFFVNSSGNIHALPVSWLFASALFFFIISHVRELKDIGADAATGVLTVAGILGPRYAAKIIGGLSSIASIVYPIFILKSWLAFLVFIPIGLASLIIATKQNRPERAIFAIYLFWLAVFIMLLV